MSLTEQAREQIDRYKTALMSIPDGELRRQLEVKEFASFRDETLGLTHDGAFRSFYAPFDWTNDQADVVIVGVTPGKSQAIDALSTLRDGLLTGLSFDSAAEAAKQSASFKGTMRTLGARLMDHFRMHELFGLRSAADLFGVAAGRAHYTSALRYPVLKNFENYSGDAKIALRPCTRQMIETHLAPELARFSRAWVIPFGSSAHLALSHLRATGLLAEDRVLGGILHPSGTQWNRYNVQLGLVDRQAALKVSGGADVLRRSDELRERVEGLIQAARLHRS